MLASPLISVIIATYNRSNVLRCAITSVLTQTFGNFELLVVGDCCTDDTEAVVLSFVDDRIRWHNLLENCGNQYGPNNHGLKHARGRYIAYLGHDDLWHPDHLATLVRAIEYYEADLVFAISEDIGPPERPARTLFGLCPSGAYEWSVWAPPSSWLHRRDLTERVGLWRDFRSIVLPTDVDYLERIYSHGCRITPVCELTVFKFTSVTRTKSYVEGRCDEQVQWWERLQKDPDLRYRELIEVLMNIGRRHPDILFRFHLPSRAEPGSMVNAYRARRGLPAAPSRPGITLPTLLPLYTDRSMLRYLNADDDIGPPSDRIKIHSASEMPDDGLFVGFNWHSLEVDADGTSWRWIDSDAQLIVTRPSGLRHQIVFDLMPGPGIRNVPCELQVRDGLGAVVAKELLSSSGPVAIDLPISAGLGAIFFLCTEDGGRPTRGDPRILNFRVFSFRWGDN